MNLRSTLSTLLLLAALLPAARAANHVLEIKSAADYVTIPDSDSLDLAATFTLEAWVKGNPGEGAVVSKRRSEGGTGVRLAVIQGKVQIGFNNDPGGNRGINVVVESPKLIEPGKWYHIATTYDGTIAKVYINGSLEGSFEFSESLINSSMPMTIGQEGIPGGPGPFLGLIDEVRVWNRALSAEEIQSRMSIQLTGEEPGLVGYWNFDDQTASDRSVYRNDGELIGGAQLVEDPLIFLQIHRAVEIISVSGSSTSTYQLQFKPDATADEWTNLGEPFTGGEPVQFFDSTRAGQKLYRAIRLQ